MYSDNRIPFTYLVMWTSVGKWYYGVRYGKKCHPSELWTKYFTSSKYVADLREQVGEPDVVEVRKIFGSIEEAAAWETKVLRRMNVIKRDDCLNVSYCTASGSLRAALSDETKAKIGAKSVGRKTFLGRKHTDETKAKMRMKIVSDETKAKLSEARKKRPPPSEETRSKMRAARLGKKHSQETLSKMKANTRNQYTRT